MTDLNGFPTSLNLDLLERLYADYARDPGSVAPDWRRYFAEQVPEATPAADGSRVSLPTTTGTAGGPATGSASQECVDLLIQNYRMRGHMIAQIDPLGLPRAPQPELDLDHYGFKEADLDQSFATSSLGGPPVHTLREIVERLRNTYCRSIGVQFMHIDELPVRQWLQERMEATGNRRKVPRDEQLRILTRLTDAVIFEDFLQKKFPGAKTFSLQGAESLIPLLDLVIERAGEHGVQEVVLGMAHRGRLNVLANIVGKSPRDIFREFEDKDPDLHLGRGDVKYHLGHSTDWQTVAGQRLHLSLCFNPSHLEFVNPVVLGRLRAKQDRFNDQERARGMAVLIHGDAAFAGEGVNQETLNLSELAGYHVGGALHVVVNNQLGFTTSPAEGRSSTYATDVARMLHIPVFHVNGEDPEAVAQVVHLAMEFRRAFRRDVVIDMYCYRVHGHNEGDEPTFTQPVMYRAIRKRQSVRAGYLEHLLKMGEVTREEADHIAEERRQLLERELAVARSDDYAPGPAGLTGVWSEYRGGPVAEADEVDTGVDAGRLADLLDRLTRLPEGFHLHPKAERLLQARRAMGQGKQPLDYATAEALAFATLATEGIRVRMSGQDTARGTFSQRHAVLHDTEDSHGYLPLQHLAPDQAPVEVYNSPLSEIGVLGFEYGYSLDCPDGLVLWEAQFGDFVNVGQVIIDQFLVSAEDKWHRLSHLVLLLPHGFEGQGPEHSSARLERFLMLAAEDNIQVVYPSTPAQYFHCLRRQARRRWRKPLVVMTLKSLLRNPRATSALEDCARGRFQNVIPDPHAEHPEKVRRILLCSGKVFYDLEHRREETGRADVAVVRLEQLYPIPHEDLEAALAGYADGTAAVWVQEEPENMGGWRFVRHHLGPQLLGKFPLSAVCRPASASPATGSASSHKLEQGRLLEEAFGEAGKEKKPRSPDSARGREEVALGDGKG